MKITFTGTGTSQGVPLIGCLCSVCTSINPKDNRLRSSVYIQIENTSIVIDSGPDFRQQMLRAKIKQLDALIFTHGHKDHVAGMDDIRAFNFLSGKPIDVYADEQTQEVLKREFAYVFSDIKYPGIPDINLHALTNDIFEINNIPVTPIEVLHYKLPVKGFRIKDFTYITDANFISEEEKNKIRGSKVLVLNALRKEKHISHFTMDEAVSLALDLEVPKVFFTHISHQLGLHEEVNKTLPSHIQLAYDGLELIM